MNGFTIKSVSDDGTYYLVKNWEQNKTFWKHEYKLNQEDLYKTSGFAKRSLKALLKVMWDYADDDLEIVEFKDGVMFEVEKLNGRELLKMVM